MVLECFFIYNAFCVISDYVNTKTGTIIASIDRFMKLKIFDFNYKET